MGRLEKHEALRPSHAQPWASFPSHGPAFHSFIMHWSSGKYAAFLSSVSCSSKLTEPEERAMGTSHLKPIGQKADFLLTSEVCVCEHGCGGGGRRERGHEEVVVWGPVNP